MSGRAINGWGAEGFSEGAAQALRQVRVAARPVQDSSQEALRGGFICAQAIGQGGGFILCEVIQFDPAADVEGSHPGVPDQIEWGRDAQQAESQAAELGLPRAPIVTLADRGEEL